MQVPRLVVTGAINWDTTLFVDRLPAPGEEVSVNRVISVAGGKGANTAVAAARILGKGEVTIIGAMGNDDIAAKQTEAFIEEGIDTSCLFRNSEKASGQAYVVVDAKGENMILTHRAANRALSRQFLSSRSVVRAVETARTVIIIDPALDVATELAFLAKRHSKTVVFSPATLVYQGFSALKELLLKADYIIQNEHEAEYLASEAGGANACQKLSRMLGGKAVITTLGSKGCVLCRDGIREIVSNVDPGLFGMKVVSTVGAGDAFVGAFASFNIIGKNDLESIFLANVAAALKITREQTRGSPTHEEIMRHAESQVLRPAYDRIRGHFRPSSRN
jgi:ribokinase